MSERLQKIRKVAARRQLDLTVVLENVHDPHNISAVIRTCDAVGVAEIYVLYTDPRLQELDFSIGKKSSGGSGRWVQIHRFLNHSECFETVRSRYQSVVGTSLIPPSTDLYSVDLNESVAIVFGNEHDGLSQATLQVLDQSMSIPQVGMVQSLNISVACAVTLYEAFRQRWSVGKYDYSPRSSGSTSPDREALLERYLRLQQEKKHFNP